MTISQDLRIIEASEGPTLSIGNYIFEGLTIASTGPIIETLTPGAPNPLRCAWVPILFEGDVHDPKARCRIVHQDEALLVGLPEGHELPSPGTWATPEQLLTKLHAATYDERITILKALLDHANMGTDCFVQDHAGRLAEHKQG